MSLYLSLYLSLHLSLSLSVILHLLSEYKSSQNKELLESAEAVLDDIITYDDSKFDDQNECFVVKPEWSKMEHKITQEENEETSLLLQEQTITNNTQRS